MKFNMCETLNVCCFQVVQRSNQVIYFYITWNV